MFLTYVKGLNSTNPLVSWKRVTIAAKHIIPTLQIKRVNESRSIFLKLPKIIRKEMNKRRIIDQGWVSKLAPEIPTNGKSDTKYKNRIKVFNI